MTNKFCSQHTRQLASTGLRSMIGQLLPSNLRAERLYNESQIRTPNYIEMCLGVWKCRFPGQSLGLKVSLSTTVNIIVASGVLRNIAIQNDYNLGEVGVQVYEPAETSVDADENLVEVQGYAIVRSGLIRDYYARLVYFYKNHKFIYDYCFFL